MESLDIALKNSFHEHAARAYSNIAYNYLEFKEYDLAEKIFAGWHKLLRRTGS